MRTFADGLLAFCSILLQLDEFFHGTMQGYLRRAEYGGVT